MNYICLDLEFNNAQDNSTPDPKIIQIGISIGNQSQIILSKCWYIDPKEPIFEFITQLTGIDDSTIKMYSSSLDDVAEELSYLIKTHECFVNPVTWGSGDVVKLLQDFKKNNIKFPFFGRRELDVKQIYVYLMFAQNKQIKAGLSSAMGRFKLQFKGKAHRADVDAENTLRFYFALLERQNKIEKLLEEAKSVQY